MKFLQFIKIVFLTLVALCLIAAMGVFIFFQTFDTDQYLSPITQKASFILGRPVSIGHLGLGLSLRGITLDAGPLIVPDDFDFTTQPFIKIDRIRVSFDLLSLILRREVHVTGILLQSPQIHIIRSQEGNFNFRSIFQQRNLNLNKAVIGNGVEVNDAQAAPTVGNNQVSAPAFHAIRGNEIAKSITIQDAAISFIDQSQAMPLDIWLKDINLKLSDISLSKPIPLSFDASLYSDDHNVHAGALLTLGESKRSFQLNDLNLSTDFSRLDAQQLKGISPGMSDNSIFKDITGIVQLNLAHLGIGASGDVEADGGITITGGVIKNFNIIKTVLSQTLGIFGGIEIGGMENKINDLLNGQFKDTLGAQDTVINKAHAQFSFHDKTVFIDDSLIQTNIFEFTAKGSMDQGLNVNMQTTLHLNTDVSTALVNEIEGLKYLMDNSQRIAIDASLEGVIPHLKYKPSKSFKKKSRKVLMEEGGNILGILLGGH